MKVLIVDNDEQITTMLSRFFDAKGIQHIVSNDPRDGLERIKNEEYDVVLLDIAMPQFSGLDIIDTLSTDEILQNKNIFIFSAILNSPKEINEMIRKGDIKGYLKKPMELNDLLTAITC